jgi:hypothetical protein
MTGAIAYCFKACETSSSPALLNKVDQLGLLTKIFFIYSFGEAATLLFLCFYSFNLFLDTDNWRTG